MSTTIVLVSVGGIAFVMMALAFAVWACRAADLEALCRLAGLDGYRR